MTVDMPRRFHPARVARQRHDPLMCRKFAHGLSL
jgi:hypothetical protein